MTKMGKTALVLSISLTLTGCAKRATPQVAAPQPDALKPEMKPAPPTPIAEKKEELGAPSWDPQWDEFVESALAPEMVSARGCAGREAVLPAVWNYERSRKRPFGLISFRRWLGPKPG